MKGPSIGWKGPWVSPGENPLLIWGHNHNPEIEIKTVSSTRKRNVLLKSLFKQNCLCYFEKNLHGFLWWSPSVAKTTSLDKG